MTTATQPEPPTIQIPIEHRRKTRKVPVTIGAAIATVGSVIALAGGGVLAVAGDDGTIGSGQHEVSTPTAALVTDTADFDGVSDLASAVGEPELGVSAGVVGDDPAKFVGIGRADDVDRYLAGVEVDRVDDIEIEPFRLDKERIEGNRTPTAPTAQSFWVAQDSGTHADVDWKVRDGDYKVVVMNADGSREVKADSHFEMGAPYLSSLALSALLAGLVLIGGGGVLVARNVRYR
jgi:hypothetical protein